MLRPIPAKILTHNAVLKQCTGMDAWQKATYQDIVLSHVCIQPEHRTQLAKDNTEVVLQAVMFADARLSQPQGIDLAALQDASEANGSPLMVEYNGRKYTVVSIDVLCDDRGKYHHAEVGLR